MRAFVLVSSVLILITGLLNICYPYKAHTVAFQIGDFQANYGLLFALMVAGAGAIILYWRRNNR
jgi:uncharacterized protein YjeT (DUF2065 family)